MQEGILHAHSGLRWIILILAVVSVGMAKLGWFGKKPYTATHKRLALLTTITLDIQLLIGLVMYFFTSSVTTGVLKDFSIIKEDAGTMYGPRFFAMEHLALMIIAIALFHIGKVKAQKATTDHKKHKITALFFGIGLILILAGIPWQAGRYF